MEATLKTKYKSLSSGKQRQLKQAYVKSIGTLRSFYRKINGQTPLRKPEVIFFNQQLG